MGGCCFFSEWFLFQARMEEDLLAIRSRGGGHDIECPGLEPPGLITATTSDLVCKLLGIDDLRFSFFSDGSYMIVLCSKLRRSNMRTLPSAPQLTNTSTLFAQKRTSYTSLSCAISCVLAVNVGISQIVHVVSMLDVIIRLGDSIFQSSEVIGAVCSGDLELDKRASGDNFAGDGP